jgi:leucyl-tRNA synthetase
MQPLEIQQKWQQKWKNDGTYKFDKTNLKNKYYLLEMFSYPSASTLHLGHWFNYSLSDSFGRFKAMQGYNVFHPMGFDAFGLPAENYALKTGIHPKESTERNMQIMTEQLSSIGATYDWDYTLATCNPEYYHWTQWLFIKLFEKGLAYQKHAPVNWCTSCNTVLANEQVIDGHCERCKSQVIRKEMTQWFFKITDYCERLLEGLDRIDWPEKTKIAQRNWIGKSIGAEVDFELENGQKITVFTSRVDTLFGVTWIVLAPEHKLVADLTTPEQKQIVEQYVQQAAMKDEITRQSTTGEKTGVFTGSYAIHPLTGKKLPVFIADYVLATYATGAVMGVAAHDERDFVFAQKHGLEIIKVIENPNGQTILPYTENGTLVNSGEFDGMDNQQAKEQITKKLESLNKGRQKVNYKLRDWSVSRQRYWGCPIPIVYDKDGKPHAVSEDQLPITLPNITDYRPKGTSPLGQNAEYMNTTLPDGSPAVRDADTLDTFICSSWYFLRYPNAQDHTQPFDKEFTNKMLPVDKYVGGMEHATGHLLYARFITKFLFDCGYIDFDEPFTSLVHQGMILGADGQKMSKSKGNTVNLDEYIKQYGSDALRLYLAFGFNYIEGGPWNDSGIKSMSKFIDRVERMVEKVQDNTFADRANLTPQEQQEFDKAIKELEFVEHNTIKECTQNMEEFAFNSAVARIMELVNAIYKYDTQPHKDKQVLTKAITSTVLLLAPFIPHYAEEFWQQLGHNTSVHKQSYPTFDQAKLVQDQVEIAVQINSKIITRIFVETNLNQEQIINQCLKDEKIATAMAGKQMIKSIVIPNRLVNIIVK